jgi:hypothetical protein
MRRQFGGFSLPRQHEWAQRYVANLGGIVTFGSSPLDPVGWSADGAGREVDARVLADLDAQCHAAWKEASDGRLD